MSLILSLFVAVAQAQEAAAQVAAPAGAPPEPHPLMSMVPLGLMLVVVYFMMIRPQQKRMKEQQSLLEKLKHGDEVVTQSGIFGTISQVNDKIVTLEVDKNVKLRVLKAQIATVVTGEKAKS